MKEHLLARRATQRRRKVTAALRATLELSRLRFVSLAWVVFLTWSRNCPLARSWIHDKGQTMETPCKEFAEWASNYRKAEEVWKVYKSMKAVKVTFVSYKELTKIDFENEFERFDKFKKVDVVRAILNELIAAYNHLLEKENSEIFTEKFSIIVNNNFDEINNEGKK